MSLADSMLAYGKKKIKLSQAGKMGERISSIGDVVTEAGQAVSSIGKAVKPNIETYKQVQAGRETIGAEADKGTLWQRLGLKSSLDDKISVGEDNYKYTTEGLKEIGTLSTEPLAEKGGYLEKLSENAYKDKDWWKQFGEKPKKSLTNEVISEIKDPVVPDAPVVKDNSQDKTNGDNLFTDEQIDYIMSLERSKGLTREQIIEFMSNKGSENNSGYDNIEDYRRQKNIEAVINLDKNDKEPLLKEDQDNVDLGGTEDDVKEKQRILVEAGYDIGEYGKNKDGIDGIYGKMTSAAWELYQESLNKNE